MEDPEARLRPQYPRDDDIFRIWTKLCDWLDEHFMLLVSAQVGGPGNIYHRIPVFGIGCRVVVEAVRSLFPRG